MDIVESLLVERPEFERAVRHWREVEGTRKELKLRLSELLTQSGRTAEKDSLSRSIDDAWQRDKTKQQRFTDRKGEDYVTDELMGKH